MFRFAHIGTAALVVGLLACVDLSTPQSGPIDGSTGPSDEPDGSRGQDIPDAGPAVPRLKITIRRGELLQNGAIEQDLTDYPLLISVQDDSLRSVANGGKVQNEEGDDLLFRGGGEAVCGSTGPCEIPFEIEKYDKKKGRLMAWLLLPRLKMAQTVPGNFVYLYFGEPKGGQRAAELWKEFDAVWHFSEPIGSNLPTKDSSEKSLDCRFVATGSQSRLESNLGWAVDLDGVDDHVACPGVGGGTQAFTVQAFLRYKEEDLSQTDRLIGKTVGIDPEGAQFHFSLDTEDGRLVARLRTQNRKAELMSVTNALPANLWSLITFTYDGTKSQLYIGRKLILEVPLTGRTLAADGTPVLIGGMNGPTNRFAYSTFDEVRIAPTFFPAARIALDALIWQAPTSYVSVLAE